MKQKKRRDWIVAFGLLAAVLVGCTEDPSLIDKEAHQRAMEVRVTTSVIPSQSRATNLTSDNIDHFGLMVNRAAPGNNWTGESQTSRVKNGAEWQPWVMSPKLGWDNLTNNVEALAYAPFQKPSLISVSSNPINRNLTFNATTQSGTEPIDWLYYYSGRKSFPNLVDAEGVIPVQFVHIMSRLRVEVTAREELAGAKATAVEVLGTLPTLEWSSSAPAVINAKGTAATVYATGTGEAEDVWSTFIVPQTMLSPDFKIRVTMNGKIYTYTHPTNLTFATAKAYKFALRLGRDKLELAPDGVTVTDWETGDDIPGGNVVEKPTIKQVINTNL